MKLLKEILKDLRTKRLLPVAIVLIVAAVAVPFFLHGGKSGRGIPTEPKATAAVEPAPLVEISDQLQVKNRKLTAFPPKDPFIQQKAGSGPKDDSGTVTPIGSDDSSSDPKSSGPSRGSAGGDPTTVSPGSGDDSGGKTHYYRWSIDARFGVTAGIAATGIADKEKLHKKVTVLTSLPSETNPVVTFIGLSRHSHSAIFLLDRGVSHEGFEGNCKPSPGNCTYLYLRPDGDHNEHLFYRKASRKYAIKLKTIRREVVSRDNSRLK